MANVLASSNPAVFDVYFATIVGFQYHPANPQATRMTLDDCAAVALQMLELRQEIIGGGFPRLGAHDLEGI